MFIQTKTFLYKLSFNFIYNAHFRECAQKLFNFHPSTSKSVTLHPFIDQKHVKCVTLDLSLTQAQSWIIQQDVLVHLYKRTIFFPYYFRSSTKRTPTCVREDGYQRSGEWYQSGEEQILSGQLKRWSFVERALGLLSEGIILLLNQSQTAHLLAKKQPFSTR